MTAPAVHFLPDELPARPALKKGLRVIRRDELTLQLGVDPQRAVVFAAPSTRVALLVEHLDGRAELGTLARRHELSPATVRQTVRDLLEAGVLEGAPSPSRARAARLMTSRALVDSGPSARTVRRAEGAVAEQTRRLEPDLAAWSLLESAPDSGPRERERRAATTVAVTGSGRLATAVTLLLASAGVGQLVAGADRAVRHSDRVATGLGAGDVGRPLRSGLRTRLAEIAPGTRLVGDPAPAELVLVTDGGVDPEATRRLHIAGTAHLVLGVRETVGWVGPLVVPGRTSCLRCHQLSRVERDPGWALVADQLAAAARATVALCAADSPVPGSPTGDRKIRGIGVGAPAVEACDSVLATIVAATAALHALTWLRGQVPPSVDGAVEFRLPDGSGRRRGFAVHPRCGCTDPAGT